MLVTSTAVVRPAALEAIDPDAAAALPPIPASREQRPVTYVRGLVIGDTVDDGTDASTWIVLDSISGRILASGSRSTTTPAG